MQARRSASQEFSCKAGPRRPRLPVRLLPESRTPHTSRRCPTSWPKRWRYASTTREPCDQRRQRNRQRILCHRHWRQDQLHHRRHAVRAGQGGWSVEGLHAAGSNGVARLLDRRKVRAGDVVGLSRLGEQSAQFERLLRSVGRWSTHTTTRPSVKVRVMEATDGAAMRPTCPATSGRSAVITCSAALVGASLGPGLSASRYGTPAGGGAVAKSTPSLSNWCGPSG